MILRVLQTLALWGLIYAVWAHAWMTSVAASTYDTRVPWGVGVCVLAWGVGQLLLWAGFRAGLRLQRLDFTRHGLALLFAALAAAAMSHVGPHMSIRVVREEIPPIFLWIFPAFVAGLPLWLSFGAKTRRAADQLLQLAIFATAMSGAMFFLQPAVAVGLGVVALSMQLADSRQHAPPDALLWVAGTLVALFALATLNGINPLDASPSMRWIVASSALGLAVAWRRRTERDWRDLLGASVTAAVIIALCGLVLTAYLAQEVALAPALRSRLVLFRQHPNFLAPFFGFHAVLSVVLAARRRVGALPWLLAAALLLASTWMTDSRTGIASTAIALLLLPSWWMLAALQRRMRLRWVFGAGLVLAAICTFGVRTMHEQGRLTALTLSVTRLQESMAFRADAWSNSVAIVSQNPWGGVGPQTFLSVYDFTPESRFFNAVEAPHPHDVFLYVAQSAGVPALLLFLLWMTVLMRRLWRRFTGPEESVPRALLAGVLAGAIGLLLANLLDLGLALQTVVPAPLFLVTGLVVSDRSARRNRVFRPARNMLWAGALGAVFFNMSFLPVRAVTNLVQAEMYFYEAGQAQLGNDFMDRARQALRSAVRHDPTVPRAHELLARCCESLPEGFIAAREVLLHRIAIAPRNAEGHALLGQLYMRNQMFTEAAEEFRLALADRQGGPRQLRHRADLILCVARSGDREAALETLVDALRLDAGVHHQIAWMDPPAPRHSLQIGSEPYGANAQPFISLIEALELLCARHIADRDAGRPVGRTIWMGTYRAFREAGFDWRAAQILDDLEANEPDVEPFTISAGRASLAYDAGDFLLAVEQWELAHKLSGRPYYLHRAGDARRAMGETVAAAEQSQDALSAWWEILDLPTAFRDSLESQAENSLALDEPARAAGLLHRSLLFQDDLLDRAHLLHRIAALAFEGGDLEACELAVGEALVTLDAKPFPWPMLVEEHMVGLPSRLARTQSDAWRAEGLATSERLQRAWELPAFFSSRAGPTLFRLAFYLENGMADRLLREADLALLEDPRHQPALWSRLFGLEGSGKHGELGAAMRTLAEVYASVATPERQFDILAAAYTAQPQLMDDPTAWRQIAMLTLLRGRYAEAIGMFKGARERLGNEPKRAAEVAGWQALAAFLAGRTESGRDALRDALRLDPSNDMLRQRWRMVAP